MMSGALKFEVVSAAKIRIELPSRNASYEIHGWPVAPNSSGNDYYPDWRLGDMQRNELDRRAMVEPPIYNTPGILEQCNDLAAKFHATEVAALRELVDNLQQALVELEAQEPRRFEPKATA